MVDERESTVDFLLSRMKGLVYFNRRIYKSIMTSGEMVDLILSINTLIN